MAPCLFKSFYIVGLSIVAVSVSTYLPNKSIRFQGLFGWSSSHALTR